MENFNAICVPGKFPSMRARARCSIQEVPEHRQKKITKRVTCLNGCCSRFSKHTFFYSARGLFDVRTSSRCFCKMSRGYIIPMAEFHGSSTHHFHFLPAVKIALRFIVLRMRVVCTVEFATCKSSDLQ